MELVKIVGNKLNTKMKKEVDMIVGGKSANQIRKKMAVLAIA